MDPKKILTAMLVLLVNAVATVDDASVDVLYRGYITSLPCKDETQYAAMLGERFKTVYASTNFFNGVEKFESEEMGKPVFYKYWLPRKVMSNNNYLLCITELVNCYAGLGADLYYKLIILSTDIKEDCELHFRFNSVFATDALSANSRSLIEKWLTTLEGQYLLQGP